jgi:hypothetical protein
VLPAETFCGIAPIISGLHKLQKLNAQPYANYYAAFAQVISASPRLLIIGYGKGDDHINHWIREFAQIHNQAARIVEITDCDDPATFAVQRITEWPNLNWSRYQGSSDVYKKRGGVQNLVITSGLHSNSNLPARFEELVMPFYRASRSCETVQELKVPPGFVVSSGERDGKFVLSFASAISPNPATDPKAIALTMTPETLNALTDYLQDHA